MVVERGGQGVGVAVAEGKGLQVEDVVQVTEPAGAVHCIHLAGHGAVAVHAEQLHARRVVPADEGAHAAVAQAERGSGAAPVQWIYLGGELRVRRGHCSVLVHADELDAAVFTTTIRVQPIRGHQGVRVAVAEGEHVKAARPGERVVGAAAGAQAAVARLAGRREGRVLVHADQLDGAVAVAADAEHMRGHHGIRVAVAQGERLYVVGVCERRKFGPHLRLLASAGQQRDRAAARHMEQPD